MFLNLDWKSLTGFSEPPRLEAMRVDIDRLVECEPSDALKYLVALRSLGMWSQFQHFHEQSNESGGRRLMSPLVKRMYTPINPLLLITALSASVSRKHDESDFLIHYARGLEIPAFEDSLIKIAPIHDPAELLGILEREEPYYQALMDLGISILVKCGRLIGELGPPTMLDLYWACWLIVNPVFKEESIPARTSTEERAATGWLNGWARGLKWGNDYNSVIHNAREFYEFELNAINESLNMALAKNARSECDLAELEEIANHQRAVSLLVQRARRLYYWAPHEISAYSAEIQVAIEIMEASGDEMSEFAIGMRRAHEKFMLPEHILDRIKYEQAVENPNVRYA